jgi:hypothetical protein
MTEKWAPTILLMLSIIQTNGMEQRKNIEILKLRFGDAPLQVCEVMLRDMTDSKRIDQHIQSQKQVCRFPPLSNRFPQAYLVGRSSNDHIAKFLARTTSWWSQNAGTVSSVGPSVPRLCLRSFSDTSTSDCKKVMRRSL